MSNKENFKYIYYLTLLFYAFTLEQTKINKLEHYSYQNKELTLLNPTQPPHLLFPPFLNAPTPTPFSAFPLFLPALVSLSNYTVQCTVHKLEKPPSCITNNKQTTTKDKPTAESIRSNRLNYRRGGEEEEEEGERGG